MSGNGADHRPAARRGEEQATPDHRAEQGDDQPRGQADAAPEGEAAAGRALVLLDDLDLAVVLALDDGRVESVDVGLAPSWRSVTAS